MIPNQEGKGKDDGGTGFAKCAYSLGDSVSISSFNLWTIMEFL